MREKVKKSLLGPFAILLYVYENGGPRKRNLYLCGYASGTHTRGHGMTWLRQPLAVYHKD